MFDYKENKVPNKKRILRTCDHGRLKNRCKDCGTGYCDHGRQKYKCKDCGTGYCDHGREKYKCKDCGTGCCDHGRRKSTCKDCGTGYCDHGRQKSTCKDCGTGYCDHGRQKHHCKECGTMMCASCQQVGVQRKGFLCYGCRVGTDRIKQLEAMVKTHLESDPSTAHFSYHDQALPCAPNRRRPDFTYILPDRVVVTECDEDCHRHYNRECEIARITELMEQCGALPLILIRFNPKQRCLPQLTREIISAFTRDLESSMFQCKFVAYTVAAEYDPVEEITKLGRKRAREDELQR
jgi:hypothetical protein